MTKRVTIEALAEWLRERDDVVLIGHLSPDGDAVGSTLGLCRALNRLGKRAVTCLPGGVPKLYAHLPGADAVIPAGEPLPFEPGTAFSVDVSEYSRMGDAACAVFDACPHRAVLDHHATNQGFGQVMMLDGKAASAGGAGRRAGGGPGRAAGPGDGGVLLCGDLHRHRPLQLYQHPAADL